MKKTITKQTIIMVALTLMCGLFLFSWVSAGNECPYHKEHTQACGYVESVEGHECNHEHSEDCYKTTLICELEEHTHSDECYDENGTLVCELKEHTHMQACYDKELDCHHVHDDKCGYQETIIGQECTHRCSYCDKTLVREGKIEIKEDDTQSVVHITSTLTGTKGDDQVYFYIKVSQNILDRMSLLVVQDYKYEISCVDENDYQSHLIMEPIYKGDEDGIIYLKYEQKYDSSIQFDIPLDKDDSIDGEKILLTTASSFNEAEHIELASYTFGNSLKNIINPNINTDKEEDTIIQSVSYSVNTLSDDDPDTNTYLDDYIYNTVLKKYVDNKPVNVTDGNVTAGDIINLSIEFSIPSGIVTSDNRSVYYRLPENVRPLKELSGNVYENGIKKGIYHISTDGLITITYDEEYANGEALAGEIHFDGNVGLTGSSSESETIVIGKTSFTINPAIVPKEYDINTIKSVNKDETNTNLLHYTVDISSIKGTESSILIEDTLSGGAKYDKDSFKLIDNQNNEINVSNLIEFNSDETSFTINNIPQLQENSKYILTYNVIVDPYQADTNGQQTITNNIKASSGSIFDIDSSTSEISTQRISKSGNSTRGDGYISWTINLYNVKSGYEILESIPEGLTWEDATASISPNIDGKNTIHFTKNSDGTYSYVIPESVTTETNYTITFKTKVDDPGDFDNYKSFTNTAELKTPDNGPTYSDDSTVTYYNERAVDKKFTNIVSSNSNGATYQWDVTLTTPNLNNVTNYTYSDTLSSNNEYALHHLTSDFLNTLKLTDQNGKNISPNCYTIVYYNSNGEVTNDTSQAVKFEIQFNDSLKNLNPSKIYISYQSYADYTMASGESAWFSNKGSIDYTENNTDKHYESSGNGQWYSKPAALTKSFVGESNASVGGATYKWQSVLNLPPLNDLSEYIYEDNLSSDSNNGNHYIASEEEFKNNLKIVYQDGVSINEDCYVLEFIKNNDIIVGYKIKFDVQKLQTLSNNLSQLTINYQTNVKYDMLPGKSETYTNSASVNGSTSNANHSHTKDPAVKKNYIGYTNQTKDGAIYQWKSVLTVPSLTSNTTYTYTDMVSSLSKHDNHYILKDDLNLCIKDENNNVLAENTHYQIDYLDKDGQNITNVENGTRIYGFTVTFLNSSPNESQPEQLNLTYCTHVEYDMYPSESDTYINDATVKIDNEVFNDQATINYRKDDAVKKTLSQTNNQSREGAEYTWKTTLTFPNIDSLTTYEYIDQLSSSLQSSENINHYIDINKFNLSISDNNSTNLDSKYYTVQYLDDKGELIPSDSINETKIAGFKIIFNLENTSDSSSFINLNCEKIYITYTTIAIYDMKAGESVDYRNKAGVKINDNTYEVITSTSYTKEQLLKKLSGVNKGRYAQSDQFGAYTHNRKIYLPEYFETEQTVNKEEIDGKLFYMILIKPDKTDGNDTTITVKDTLPEGVKFIGTNHEDDKNNDFAPYIMYYYTKWNYSDYGKWINEKGKNIYLDDYFSYAINDNVITFTLSEGYKDIYKSYSNGNNPYIAIVYAVDISDNASYLEEDVAYTNTVEWAGETVENTQKVHQEGTYLDKVGKSLEDQGLIRYSLIVNPSGEDLLENSDKIQLIDQMANPDSLSYLRFNPSSLKVYIYDAVNNKDIEELNKALYSYTYDITEYKLIVSLPDNLSCRVTYDYYAENANFNDVTITNNAFIEGIEESSISEDSQYEHVDSGSTVTKKRFSVYKVDSNNYNTTLANANFILYKYNNDGKDWSTIKSDLITDENGKLDFSTLTTDSNIDVKIEEGVLYKLEENNPPVGYKIENSNTYFVIQQENQNIFGENGLINNEVLEALNMSLDEAKEKIKVLNNEGDDIFIPNTLNSLQVQKLWLNQDGTTIKEHPDKILMKLLRSEFEQVEKQEESVSIEINLYSNYNDTSFKYTYTNAKKGTDFTIQTDWGCSDVIVNIIQDGNIISNENFNNNDGKWYFTLKDIQQNVTIKINTGWYLHENSFQQIFNVLYTQASIYKEWKQVGASEVKDTVELNENNQWTYVWNDLLITPEEDDKIYLYFVEEDVPSGWSVSYDGNNVQSGNIVVKNVKDKESILLPETGGTSQVLMTILGITMMSLGILYFIKKRRTHRKVGEFR